MQETAAAMPQVGPTSSFFDRPGVRVEEIPIGPGVPMGIERVSHPAVGIGGAYGAWGPAYDNEALLRTIEAHLGEPLREEERLNLAELGFLSRHHVPAMSEEEHIAVEVEVGTRFLVEACRANGWEPAEVDAVLLGITTPVIPDFTERIAARAGIREDALKVSVHKACDGAVGGLNLALNPELAAGAPLAGNLARWLLGKRVLVGGIEGLSRVIKHTFDRQALQLFGNGAGVIGVIPGRTMSYLAGGAYEAFDAEGMLQVRMAYPHSGQAAGDESLVEVTQTGPRSYCVAGLMHEPHDDTNSVIMAGPMGMVKLFVRNGVSAVRSVYRAYQERLSRAQLAGKGLAVAIAHHANFKINQLKAKQLEKEGISLPMPWLLSDFGNVSAASAMIAFLRKLTALVPGDHVLFDGFGAGTYYDVIVVELGAGA
ncbi:MAG: 3-oxoacyl-[acyl-carrier-protein] synthase III C-terminal domain-containing protein [Anaerolineae bacterium]